jgi:molecular chaperone DnaK (HSP70)
MRLGIDFGTTRTVVTVMDRGNHPVVGFEGPDGDLVDHWPSVVASDGVSLAFGLDAMERLHQQGWVGLRSLKRYLAGAGPGATVALAGREWLVTELMAGFLAALRTALLEASSCPVAWEGQALAAYVAVPAGASSWQRMATLDAFRVAGFEVVGLLNEPSAAGLEYADRYRASVTSNRQDVLVYDLGGGTLDVSLVRMGGGAHEVLAHAGDNHLGGDDFDTVLLELVLAQAGLQDTDLTSDTRLCLLLACREAKEALKANTRRLSVEVDEDTLVSLKVADYYAALKGLLDRSLHVAVDVAPELSSLAGVYVVGGASELPAVARRLREHFGRRVKRSAHASAATAMGLSIAHDDAAPVISERFSRTFGVFRELSDGAMVSFDAILTPDAAVGVDAVRRYRAAHNVGVFRFAECDRAEGVTPQGDLLPWGVLTVPFDPRLQGAEVDGVAVERLGQEGPMIEERYAVDEAGVVQVAFTDLSTGYRCAHRFAGPIPA